MFDKIPLSPKQDSILTKALTKVYSLPLDRICNDSQESSKISQNLARDTSAILTIAPLFVEGAPGYVLSGLLNGLDNTRLDKNLGRNFSLGALKGILLKGSLSAASDMALSASYKGVALGFSNNFLNLSLDPNSYSDTDKNFSLWRGLKYSLVNSLNLRHLALDGLTFMASETALGALTYKSKGLFLDSKILNNALAGGTFGLIGTGSQVLTGNYHGSWQNTLQMGIANGIIGAFGAGFGSLANSNFDFIKSSDTPKISATNLEPEQLALSNAKFSPLYKIGSDKFIGTVDDPQFGGTKFVFRIKPQDLSDKVFQRRINNEVASYTLGKLMDLSANFPLTVPYSTQVVDNGVYETGYLQEVKGVSLEDYLRSKSDSKVLAKNDIVTAVLNDSTLKQNLTDAMAQRMLYSEWDNHLHNYVVNPGGKQIYNIDLENSYPANRQTLTYGKTLSRVSLTSDSLASKLTKTPISDDFKNSLTNFVKNYDNESGFKVLKAKLAIPDESIKSFIARVKTLSEDPYLPTKPINNLYVLGLMKYFEMKTPVFKTSLDNAFQPN